MHSDQKAPQAIFLFGMVVLAKKFWLFIGKSFPITLMGVGVNSRVLKKKIACSEVVRVEYVWLLMF